MVDIAAIGGALGGLKTALDMAKAMVGLRDAEAFRSKSIELQGVILDSYEKAITAREEQSAMIDRVRELEQEIVHLKAWDAQKQNYELKSVAYGAVAYMLKPEMRGTQPPHWLCQNCYAQGKERFFQASGERHGRNAIYACPDCRAKMAADYPPKWID